MRLPFTPFLIRTPPSWTVVENTLLDATEGRISQIRFNTDRFESGRQVEFQIA